jgi:hypothetical protein
MKIINIIRIREKKLIKNKNKIHVYLHMSYNSKAVNVSLCTGI